LKVTGEAQQSNGSIQLDEVLYSSRRYQMTVAGQSQQSNGSSIQIQEVPYGRRRQ